MSDRPREPQIDVLFDALARLLSAKAMTARKRAQFMAGSGHTVEVRLSMARAAAFDEAADEARQLGKQWRKA